MHDITKNNFNTENNDPHNWAPGEIGINTTIGNINYTHPADADVNATDNTFGAPDQLNWWPGKMDVGVSNAASTGMPDKRFKPRTVEAASPAGARGLAIASLTVDAIIIGYNYLQNYLADDDNDLAKAHVGILRNAIYDVNQAAKDGKTISPGILNSPERLSDVINYVLSGVSNLNDKEVIETGKAVFNLYSMQRFKYDGIIKVTGPNGQVLINQPKPNPTYNPGYEEQQKKEEAAQNDTPL